MDLRVNGVMRGIGGGCQEGAGGQRLGMQVKAGGKKKLSRGCMHTYSCNLKGEGL
jgi:hypothetical protein